mmetsp:Transcript_95330/g.199403  ORF Transcript_95330/g.199403 Transcript_95330/m.199403 type:complete len:347 (-) Transcript_95330:619-1659(-)
MSSRFLQHLLRLCFLLSRDRDDFLELKQLDLGCCKPICLVGLFFLQRFSTRCLRGHELVVLVLLILLLFYELCLRLFHILLQAREHSQDVVTGQAVGSTNVGVQFAFQHGLDEAGVLGGWTCQELPGLAHVEDGLLVHGQIALVLIRFLLSNCRCLLHDVADLLQRRRDDFQAVFQDGDLCPLILRIVPVEDLCGVCHGLRLLLRVHLLRAPVLHLLVVLSLDNSLLGHLLLHVLQRFEDSRHLFRSICIDLHLLVVEQLLPSSCPIESRILGLLLGLAGQQTGDALGLCNEVDVDVFGSQEIFAILLDSGAFVRVHALAFCFAALAASVEGGVVILAITMLILGV